MKKIIIAGKYFRKHLKKNNGFLYANNKYWVIPCPNCNDGVFIHLIPEEDILKPSTHHFDCKICSKGTHVVLDMKSWSFLEGKDTEWFKNEYEGKDT